MPKVSVCIPVYNVEKYIERCARSLFEQTMKDDIEFIFVDDCTPDKSMEILEKVLAEYPARKKQVAILHHEKNKGLVGARNTALKVANGDYIIHCDSDDWVELDMCEKLYNRAQETDSDMVYCSHCLEYSERKSMKINLRDRLDVNSIVYWMSKDQAYQSLCTKMYKRSIAKAESIYSPEHICMNEDFLRNIQMLLMCRKISCVSESLYHYRVNIQSISKQWKKRDLDNLLEIVDYLEKNLCFEKYADAIESYKYLTLAIAVRHSEIINPAEFKPMANRLLRDSHVSFRNLDSKKLLVEISRKNYFYGKKLIDFYLILKKIYYAIKIR